MRKTVGEMIHTLRKQRREPLRVVAAGIEIDSGLLSKIEHGERQPTAQQLIKISKYFNIPLEEITVLSIADKIISSYDANEITLRALKIAEEQIAYQLIKDK